jgi:hypothetical protein
LLGYFLSLLLQNSIAKKSILLSIIPFLLFAATFFFKAKTPFSVYLPLLEFLAFIIFITYYFYEKMKLVVEYPLYQSISFWICVGLFLYFTGNFFFLILLEYKSDVHIKTQLGLIYSIVTISKNIFLSLAFFAKEQEVNSVNTRFNIPDEINLDSFHPKSTFS